MKDFDYPRSIAVKALQAILNRQEFSNDVLNQLLDDSKLSILDKKFITALVYGVLDYLPLLDEIIANASDRKLSQIDPLILNILRSGTWQIELSNQIPDSSAVDESVKLASHYGHQSATGFVNAVLREIIRKPLTLKKKQKHLKFGMTSEIYGLYKKWFGEDITESILTSYLENDSKISVLFLGNEEEKRIWLEDLNKLGIHVETGILLDNALVLNNLTIEIRKLPGYEEGLFYVQDESSMLVAETIKTDTEEYILDACAGIGGKSFSLLAKNPKIRLIALEPSQNRFSKLKENIKRLQLDQITTINSDLQDFVNENNYANHNDKFDQIILDVPCSGLGVLKHKPEIKLNLTFNTIREFPLLQLDLLEYAAKLLKPSGKLLYSTCTINPEENEQVIDRFLKTDIGKTFRALDLTYVVSSLKDEYKEELKTGLNQYGLNIRPDLIPVDGFFISYLQKKDINK